MKFKVKSTLILLTTLLLTILVACTSTNNEPVNNPVENLEIKSAILYLDGEMWKDTYSHLKQSLVANASVVAINVNDNFDLSEFDTVYLDKSIKNSPNKKEIQELLISYTKDGGGLFLDNDFWDFFDKKFIGAKQFVKFSGIPKEIEFPSVSYNLNDLQGVIKDFDYIYKSYDNYQLLSTYDYGYGIKGAAGEILAEENGIALYTVNKVGKGYVFFTNPLLPNSFNINGFSMKSTNDLQKYFANTTASCNQLIVNQFNSYISKEKYGFSVERVFGNYGRPSIAWQLHYEEITGIENNSAEIFSQIAEKYLQIPSFTIIRNSYTWFNRYEAVTYLLNNTDKGSLNFSMDEYENAYSSGTHMVSNGKYLSLDKIEDGGSYFSDYPEFDYRAYPYAADIDKDGLIDLIAGSNDGYFYYFKGEKLDQNYETKKHIKLSNSNGELLNVKGYSSPVMADLNNDDILDLISGSIDGNIYWFSGNGDLTFENEGILIDSKALKQSMPAVGDINDDGIIDLVVGSNNKQIMIYHGSYSNGNISFSQISNVEIDGIDNIEGNWIAPNVIDINNDGKIDIVVGTFHGYIAKFLGDGQKYIFDGYMEGTEKNYKGNTHLKFGNNSVPIFSDLNKDGKLDLIVGSLEYGLAYPIDSKYFPYKDNLLEQIKFMQENNYYVGVHFYTNEGASDKYEENELSMHAAALSEYGLDVSKNTGFNQHTWHLSAEDDTQSLQNGFDAGLLWNSGSKSPRSKASPEISAETALIIPFLLDNDQSVVFNTSTMLYDSKAGDITAKYDLPVSMYYHCDFAYANPANTEKNVQNAANFTNKYDYNFVTEYQYVKAIKASYNTDFIVKMDNQNITLETKVKDENIPLYDEAYQKAVGVKVVLGEKYLNTKINTDSPIWYQRDKNIYMGVGEKTTINFAETSEFHITRANLPVEVNYLENGATVKFLDGGMMQVEVKGNATSRDKNLIISKSENKDATIFTKFGEADIINIEIID